MTTPKPHIHQAAIIEWVADPSAVWQWKTKDYSHVEEWKPCAVTPLWKASCIYRRKPRWFDMEQEWIAKGKPPVEYISAIRGGEWRVTHDPTWCELDDYRFKGVSRHAALKAEWEAKGRPVVQYEYDGVWVDLGWPNWVDCIDFRIKPTPHPNADVLRALAEDGSLRVALETELWNGYKETTISIRIV